MLFMIHNCTKYWCVDNKVYIWFKKNKPFFAVFFLSVYFTLIAFALTYSG